MNRDRADCTIVTIVLARMNSVRLPGKALVDVGGVPLIAMVLERLAAHRELSPVVLATTTDADDNLLAREAKSRGVAVYRGERDDVLARLIGAARLAGIGPGEAVVKATGDNPFVDVEEAKRALRQHCRSGADLTTVHDLPIGAGVGVFRMEALERSWRESDDPVSREHPGLLMHSRPESYAIEMLAAPEAKRQPELRITIDEFQDLELARKIVARLGSGPAGPDSQAIIGLLLSDPGLRETNRRVRQLGFTLPAASDRDAP